MNDERRCARCGEWKPPEAYRADPRKPGGREYSCRECRDRVRARARQERERERREQSAAHTEVPQGARRCTLCGVVRALEDFSIARRRRDGRSPWCRDCTRVRLKKYRQTGGYRAWAARYYARPEAQERRKREQQARAEAIRERRRAYLQTPRAKVLSARSRALRRLIVTEGRAERARLKRRVAECERELRRIDREREGRAKPGPKPGRARLHAAQARQNLPIN